MEWGINKEGCRKRGERDMALLRLAAMRKTDCSAQINLAGSQKRTG